jgi:trehalose-6-phosphate synthase
MPEEKFRTYVNEEKHDFSNWIKYSLENEEFADKVSKMMKKDKLVEALSNGREKEE